MQNPIGYRYYHIVGMISVMCLLVANTVAVKVVMIGGFVLPAGIVVFPLSYIFNDVMTEVYGYEKTRSIVWTGFFCLAMMSGFYYLATILPPASFWQDQEAFAKLFGFAPRIALASFAAYLVGSFLNSFVLSYLKVRTEGKHLWARTIGSTIVGEGADSIIFNIIAFVGIFPTANLIEIIVSGFILKTLYEVLATPFTYAIVGWLKKVENEDKYDTEVNYNPFKLN